MYIDFKITTWERAEINHEEDKQAILEAIANKKLNSFEDFANLQLDCGWETLTDVSENITPEENDGFATLEVFNDENENIHANGKH